MQTGNPDLASKHQSIWMGRCVIRKRLGVGGLAVGAEAKWARWQVGMGAKRDPADTRTPESGARVGERNIPDPDSVPDPVPNRGLLTADEQGRSSLPPCDARLEWLSLRPCPRAHLPAGPLCIAPSGRADRPRSAADERDARPYLGGARSGELSLPNEKGAPEGALVRL